MIDPGRLRRRLVLEAPVETADDTGGVEVAYTAVATVWGAVSPRRALEAVEADAAGADVSYRIVVRAGPEITTRHRLRLGTRVFRIAGVRDLDATGRFRAIDAEERAD